MDRLRNFFRGLTSSPSRVVATLVVVLIVVGASSYGAVQLFGPTLRGVLPLPATEFVQGEFLVKFQPGAAADAVRNLNAQNNAPEIDRIPGIGVARLRVPTGSSVGAMVTLYGRNPNVLYAEPNYIRTATDTPNDAYFATKQWNLTKIGAPAAWDITKGNAAVNIAVIDSGIALNHEDLVGRYSGTPAADDYGHGTQVASIAGAATGNTKGMAGVCQLCTISSYKVLNSTGTGSDSATASALIAAADAGAKVVNMSLGGYATSSTLQDAVTYAWNKGVVMIAAAGNDNTTSPLYPASYANVVGVGGTDQNDARVTTSNYGSYVRVYAPGQSIVVATMAGSYTLGAGTSLAAPEVAGLAGLIFSVNPSLTNQQVVNFILGNTDAAAPGPRINACKAVAAAAGVACGTAVAASTTASPVPTVAPTATPVTTVAPTPVPTVAPTATPVPTVAPTATPVPTVAPTPAPAATTTETFTGTVSKTGTSFKEHTITVSAAGTITASLGGWTGNLSNNNLDLYLFSGGSQLAAATTANRPENLTFAVTTPGTYTLRVVAAAGTGTYTLTVTHP